MDSLQAIGFRESRVSPAAHELFRSLVESYLDAGWLPLTEQSEPLDELVSEDWLALDPTGRIAALYPFSMAPSGIDVRIGDEVRQAMCAIDALGIAPMLGTTVEVRSICPVSDASLTVSVNDAGEATSYPDGIVVVRRRASGPAYLNRCSATRFFRSEQDARVWCGKHGQADDVVLTLDDACAEASAVFGRCYTEGVRLVI